MHLCQKTVPYVFWLFAHLTLIIELSLRSWEVWAGAWKHILLRSQVRKPWAQHKDPEAFGIYRAWGPKERILEDWVISKHYWYWCMTALLLSSGNVQLPSLKVDHHALFWWSDLCTAVGFLYNNFKMIGPWLQQVVPLMISFVNIPDTELVNEVVHKRESPLSVCGLIWPWQQIRCCFWFYSCPHNLCRNDWQQTWIGPKFRKACIRTIYPVRSVCRSSFNLWLSSFLWIGHQPLICNGITYNSSPSRFCQPFAHMSLLSHRCEGNVSIVFLVRECPRHMQFTVLDVKSLISNPPDTCDHIRSLNLSVWPGIVRILSLLQKEEAMHWRLPTTNTKVLSSKH